MGYGKKSIFKMTAAAMLNLKNFNFWSRDCHGVQSCTAIHRVPWWRMGERPLDI